MLMQFAPIVQVGKSLQVNEKLAQAENLGLSPLENDIVIFMTITNTSINDLTLVYY